ncbi:hypothetical protein T09_618 [Trichinella sp. T9]|nr:hypothetical protein T09_618 [Trichinella sp. T9]
MNQIFTQIYKKVIVKVLKKTIKVWSRRDSKLKGDCRGSQRHIRLIKSPAAINDHNTNLGADITSWAVSDPGNIFCHIDKPYLKNQTKEPAMAMLKFSELLVLLFLVKLSHSQTSKCQDKPVYKAPGQNTSKIIFATAAGAWDDGAQALSNNAGHSFAKTLEDVVRNPEFLAYNNVPPGVPSMKTKSNSKGVIIHQWRFCSMDGTYRTWISNSKNSLQLATASLLLVQPMIHYNDIPETETAGMPYFNKLAEGKISPLPPFTSRRSIRTEDARSPVTVDIYSKSESSKHGLRNFNSSDVT